MIFSFMLKARIESILIKENSSLRFLLSDIKFELMKRRIYTILGENGTGKSTLIKSLTSLLGEQQYVVKGDVYFEDKNVFSFSGEELRNFRLNKIRYVFQDAANSFDPLKKFEYYFANSNSTKDKIDDMLRYFLLPDYDKLSVLYPYEVSGGMAQRISIVLAFLANPDLIILDEPTTGIDYAISNLLLIKLKEYKEKRNGTVLIVTHDMKFTETVSDEIAVLSGGRLNSFKVLSEFSSEE